MGKSCIEAANYPQPILWLDINLNLPNTDFVQVTEAYAVTLHVQQGNVNKDLGDFDPASLMMMLHFQPFQQGDVMIPDKINKVLLSLFFVIFCGILSFCTI